MTASELKSMGYIKGRTALERSYTSILTAYYYNEQPVYQSPKTREYYTRLPNWSIIMIIIFY